MKKRTTPRIYFNPRTLNLRLIAGTILIAASFASAYLISQSNNRMITVWSASNDLAPGRIIEDADVAPVQVSMPKGASLYLDANYSIVGSQVLRTVGSSELIPTYSLSKESQLNYKKVPISLSRFRLPIGVKSGSIVDIYIIPREQLNGNLEGPKLKRSQLLLPTISVDAIDMEASKLGGEIGMTILVPASQVSEIVSAMSDSEFIVVRSN
jgi:hypothetical protein